MTTPRPPRLLSIAGSDSGGGAGIQADLKAFARCGCHGMTAITAITAQNTIGVLSVHLLPPEVIFDQVRAVVEDIGVDAVKVGMLGDVATVQAVERALEIVGDVPVVLDPVMVAESGAVLLDHDAHAALVARIVPLATVVTPNLAEARILAGAADGRSGERAHDGQPDGDGEGLDGERRGVGRSGGDGDQLDGGRRGGGRSEGDHLDGEALARAVHALGPEVVVVTGGHRGEATDLFFDGADFAEIPGDRYPDGAAHGSGCTHSSTLAAQLALGHAPLVAARRAKLIAAEAVRHGLRGIGAGPGPVDVLHLDAQR